jgi:hypothetical protein
MLETGKSYMVKEDIHNHWSIHKSFWDDLFSKPIFLLRIRGRQWADVVTVGNNEWSVPIANLVELDIKEILC